MRDMPQSMTIGFMDTREIDGEPPDRDETIRMVGYYRGRRPTTDERETGEMPDVLLDPVER